MRQITKDSINAFMNAKTFKRQNMEVEVLPNVTILYLHDNPIAYRYNNPERTLTIQNCGWFSNTTKERLNALPNVHIVQRNFKWYLNGKEWNGDWIDIKTLKQKETKRDEFSERYFKIICKSILENESFAQ
tara:strand:- start:776 stop:1168 length:393 start_codon:yes stop_codon:yes gene_type:complete